MVQFNSDGKIVKTVGGEGSRTGQFDWPLGIALSKDNKLFICDKNNHRIQVFDTNLNFISCFGKGGSGEGEFWQPCDLTFDPAGDVYVTDRNNHRVQMKSLLSLLNAMHKGQSNCPVLLPSPPTVFTIFPSELNLDNLCDSPSVT